MVGPPRQRPYPFDGLCNGTGLLFGRPKQGAPLVAVRPATLDQVAPSSFEYGSQSPLAERIHVWDDLSLGYGLAIQEAFADHKSRNTICADLSIGGLMMKGPAITQLAPATTDATNGVVKLFEVAGIVFSLNGRYVHRRVSDVSWTLEKDLGVGKAATDVVVFATNAGSTTYAYVAMGESEFIWRFDGTTWTQHASLFATHFALVARDIYRSESINQVSKCDSDSDPWVAINWNNANSFRAGDKSSAITQLAVTAQSQLVILKTDGAYTLDQSGEDKQLYPFLKFAPSSENGKLAGQFLNDLHTTYNGIHYRLRQVDGGALQLQQIGPERLTENNSPVKGAVTAFSGIAGLFALGAVYDADNATAHILKFGGYITPAIAQGKLEEAKRVDVWNGSISQTFSGAGKKITYLYVSAIGAVDANHTRTYIGFADGTVGWLPNPCTPNPANCSAYTFTTNDGEIYFPFWHGQFKVDAKTLRSVTVAGLNLSSTVYAQFEYKTDTSLLSYTALGTDFNSMPSRNVDFSTSAYTTLADFRLLLKSASGSPQVTAVALHHSVRPVLLLEYVFDVLAGYGMVKRDWTPYRTEPGVVRQLLKTAAGNAGSTPFILPDQSNQSLSVVDYGEGLSWDERLKSWSAAIHIKAIQVKTNETYGTVARLGAYTVGDLAPFTVAMLGVI